MHAAELFFGLERSGKATDDMRETMRAALLELERNGQLIPDAMGPIAETRDGFRAFALTPEATSLRRSRHSRPVREALRKLNAGGLKSPAVRVLGRAPNSAATCRCARSPSLILWTHFLTREPPLTCGACGGVVPFSRFGHTTDHETYEDILFWLHHYRAFDALWLAYRQLTRHDSQLTREGLDVRRNIENRAERPVYYYLMRHHGRGAAAERKRRCPSCAGAWLLKAPWHGLFDFRCRSCRLLSNLACEGFEGTQRP